jgi:hypothetical protein
MLSRGLRNKRGSDNEHEQQARSTKDVRGECHKRILLPMAWRQGRLEGRVARFRSRNPAYQNETVEAVWSVATEKSAGF